MSITRVSGTIDEQRGEHARIKVVSFKKDGIYINTPLEIKKEFPPEGFVFAPHFFNHFEYRLNSLIEFPFSDFKSNKKDGDSFLLDFNVDIKLIGFPIFKISENILLSQYSINQTILNNYSERFDSQHFYIQYNEALYGPFKNLNTEILPKVGKEVCKYELPELSIYTSGESSYLLTAPLRNSDLIDCMTSVQLNTWLKDQIKNLKLDIDFSSLAKALESQQLAGLDIDRMKRVLTGIDQIALTHSELKYLAESSEKLEILYNRLLNKAKAELKEELINPALDEKSEIEAKISELKNSKEKLLREMNQYKEKFDVIKNEYDFIANNKERLIQDIKVYTEVSITKSISTPKLFTYYEDVFELKQNPYHDIQEFINVFNETLENSDDAKNKLGNISILQLKEIKCFISHSIEIILQIAKLSNNCKIIIQQVEPDWLKFEYLLENGLKQIWDSAFKNPDVIHFFILEDINMASIECYGKPLLDFINRIRLKLPGLDSPMPNNLWVFGVPLAEKKGFDFGLPLIKETYKNWGFFPKQEDTVVFKQINSMKYLSVEKIYDHNNIIPSSLNDYFS